MIAGMSKVTGGRTLRASDGIVTPLFSDGQKPDTEEGNPSAVNNALQLLFQSGAKSLLEPGEKLNNRGIMLCNGARNTGPNRETARTLSKRACKSIHCAAGPYGP